MASQQSAAAVASPAESRPEIGLRPITDDDLPFLEHVYGSTRAEELAVTDWSEERKAAFVHMQFVAQHAYYREHYAGCDFQVILVDGAPAGRLYVHRRPTEIRLVDIAFLPEHRGSGLGTALLAQLMAEATAAGKPLRIHVEIFNRALRLYERLGFRRIVDRGVYWFLEWRPETAPPFDPNDPALS